MKGLEIRAAVLFLRFALGWLHCGLAGLGFWRHNMTEIVPGYALFNGVGTTVAWSFVMLLIGMGLLRLPRGSAILILWQFFSVSLFVVFSVMVSGVYGVTWGTLAYFFPAALSFCVMWYSSQDWAAQHGWYQDAQARVQGRRHG